MRRFFGVLVGAAAVFCLQAGDEARAQAAGQPKVAVYTFNDTAGSGVAVEFREMVATAIINSRKFNVISRDFTSVEEEEQLRRAKKTTARAKTPVEAIDFAIEGTITGSQAGVEVRDTGGDVQKGASMFGVNLPNFGACSKQTVSINLTIKIKDIGTGLEKYAKNFNKSAESDCKRSGGAVNLPALMLEISKEVAFEFATEIYPIKVIGTQPGGTAIVNYGEAFLPPGTFLKFTTPPTKIESDGLMVDMVGVPLGRARVIEANAATAMIALEGGATTEIPVGSTGRIDENQAEGKPSKKKKGR